MIRKDTLRKAVAILQSPYKRTMILAQHGFYKNMSDEDFLRMQFKNVFGYEPDLDHPQTYSEKLQWLKLHDRRPEYTVMVDKYEVKAYVSPLIGEEHIIRTLGVWDKFDEIDFSCLPDQFVLKCTHDSGGSVICRDRSRFDSQAAKKKLEKSQGRNYYLQNREWPYKNVKPRIIAEEYMVDESGYELKDYKIFTFGGKARALLIAADRTNPHEETHFDFYDMEFNHLPFTNGHPGADHPAGKPDSLDEMRRMAERIAAAGNLPQARIDFYDVNGTVYFGEITFFHWSGFEPFVPDEWDKRFGEWLRLPEKYPANGSGNCRSREESE